MRNRLSFIAFSAIGIICLLSCEKDEGKGGTSSISGRVIVRQYNTNFTLLEEQYDASNKDVFIIYGDDDVVGEDTKTSFDGKFRFDYLREGRYTIYALSEDSANYPSQREIPVIREVNITKRNEEITLPTIFILK